MQNKQLYHGSDLEKLEAAYALKKEDLTSFSANVNPFGLSKRLTEVLPNHIELIAHYPDRDYTSLKSTISSYVKVPMEYISVGNGSTELISLCIKTVAPKKTVIIGPTYSEYEREISLMGGTCVYHPLLEKNLFHLDMPALLSQLTPDVDFLVICNPNNPTSTYLTVEQIEEILKTCVKNDIFVMIDETYIEFVTTTPDASAAPLCIRYSNLFIIRGVSKFFAAPGLRLGYSICSNTALMNQMDQVKNPWSINALAAFAGELLLTDTKYIEESKELITKERRRIVKELSTWDKVKAFEPFANFVLVKLLSSTDSRTLFEACLKEMLVIRDASTFPFLEGQFFRFCFLLPEQNDHLLEILKKNIL